MTFSAPLILAVTVSENPINKNLPHTGLVELARDAEQPVLSHTDLLYVPDAVACIVSAPPAFSAENRYL